LFWEGIRRGSNDRKGKKTGKRKYPLTFSIKGSERKKTGKKREESLHIFITEGVKKGGRVPPF